jgi:hypothetical protein
VWNVDGDELKRCWGSGWPRRCRFDEDLWSWGRLHIIDLLWWGSRRFGLVLPVTATAAVIAFVVTVVVVVMVAASVSLHVEHRPPR